MRAPDGTLATLHWIDEPGFSAALTTDAVGLTPAVSRRGAFLGVGIVRLDNRDEVARWANRCTLAAVWSDLDLVIGAIEACGTSCIPKILGDFALVVWHAPSRTLLAVRDPLGGKNLFHSRRGDTIAVCSRSSPLADGDAYDMDWIASFLVAGSTPSHATVFAGVSAVPAGTLLTFGERGVQAKQFWNARNFEIDERLVGEAQYEEFRSLFADAVRLRLTGGNDTWAQLSGGLDSSSIVCMAQTLAASGRVPMGVSGTITFADTLAALHETEYSDAVCEQYGVANEKLVDYWAWQDDGLAPPLTDRPVPLYPFYAQVRRMHEVARRAGCRVMLSGYASDFYLSGNLFFFADLLARGQVLTAMKEMVRWSVAGRVSVWKMAFENGLVPLLPAWGRKATQRDPLRVPAWIDQGFARRAGLEQHSAMARQLDAPIGRKYAGAIAYAVDALGDGIDSDVVSDAVDVRHPFLHRPLIEFALRLPPAMRTRAHARKWVLREAMRDVLPESVRTRAGKGTISSRVAWSFDREHARVEQLLRNPLLAQLNCIDVDRLKVAVSLGQDREIADVTTLMSTLALETWLRVRSGRWTARE
jgi:asparagine synthase (glutamine-hydrolysing)